MSEAPPRGRFPGKGRCSHAGQRDDPPPPPPSHRRLLPADLHVFGYARSALTDESLREQLRKFLKGDSALIEGFLSVCTYIQGQVIHCTPGLCPLPRRALHAAGAVLIAPPASPPAV